MAARVVPVSDPADPRLAPYRCLRDAELRRQVEADQGVFVAEGRLALDQLAASPYPVVSALVTPEKLGCVPASLDAPVYVAPREVLAATVGFDLHRGVVAVGRRLPPARAAEVVGRGGTVLVVEGVNDQENLGALFRNARALGVSGVLLDPTCADPLYRRSVRVSLGHVLAVPFARLAPWPDGLQTLREAGYRIVALTPGSAARPLPALGPPEVPTAVLVGAEGPGLSPGALAGADVEARIPMAPGVDSLNVATAAAVALFHLGTAGTALA